MLRITRKLLIYRARNETVRHFQVKNLRDQFKCYRAFAKDSDMAKRMFNEFYHHYMERA